MAAVRKLCRQGMVLNNGKICFVGSANEAVEQYIGNRGENSPLMLTMKGGCEYKDIEFLSARFAQDKNTYASNEPIEFVFEVLAHRDVPNFRINTTIFSLDDTAVGSVSNTESLSINNGERREVRFMLYDHNLASGWYTIAFSVGIGNYLTAQRDFDIISNQLAFSIVEADKEHRL